MFAEIADGAEDLIVLHDALNFGHCHLGLGIPTGGRFADINDIDALRVRPQRRRVGYRVGVRFQGFGIGRM